jgi:hypothetical protein
LKAVVVIPARLSNLKTFVELVVRTTGGVPGEAGPGTRVHSSAGGSPSRSGMRGKTPHRRYQQPSP